MELTKQDKKNIQERTRKLSFRITEEAREYSRLYEKTYYEEVIKVCQRNIEIIDSLHEQTIKMSEDDKEVDTNNHIWLKNNSADYSPAKRRASTGTWK